MACNIEGCMPNSSNVFIGDCVNIKAMHIASAKIRKIIALQYFIVYIESLSTPANNFRDSCTPVMKIRVHTSR